MGPYGSLMATLDVHPSLAMQILRQGNSTSMRNGPSRDRDRPLTSPLTESNR